MIRLVVLASVVVLAFGNENEVISVPQDVLKFIIGCRQAQAGGQFAVPVHTTSINDAAGTTSQHVSLLSVDELRSALKHTVNSEAVIGHIIKQVEEATQGDAMGQARSDCTVENNISISVPAGEVDSFNDRVQMLMQQNSFKMLEQINTLFSFKLRLQKSETDKMIKRRTNKILEKLDKIMQHLGIPDVEDNMGEDYVGEDYEDVTLLPEIVTWPDLEPTTEAQPQPETPTTESVSSPESLISVESVTLAVESEPAPEITSGPSANEQPVTGSSIIEVEVPTEIFPSDGSSISGSSSSSSEEDDSPSEGEEVPDRTAASDNQDAFIRTPQQSPENIVFNSGIGLIRPLTRRRPIPARPAPVYSVPTASSLEERLRMAAERRRIIQSPFLA